MTIFNSFKISAKKSILSKCLLTLILYSLVPFPFLSASKEENKETRADENISEVTLTRKKIFLPPFDRKKRPPAETLSFPALSICPFMETGADLVDFSIDESSPFAAIEFPHISILEDGPSAELTFVMPKDYKKELQSSISLFFLASYSPQPIKGAMRFTINANILHSNGECEVITMGKETLYPLKSTGIPLLIASQVRSYNIKIGRLEKVRKGDHITFTITRDNSIENNFEGSVFVPALRINYNIPGPVIL